MEVDYKLDLCLRCINYLLFLFIVYDFVLKGIKVNGMND